MISAYEICFDSSPLCCISPLYCFLSFVTSSTGLSSTKVRGTVLWFLEFSLQPFDINWCYICHFPTIQKKKKKNPNILNNRLEATVNFSANSALSSTGTYWAHAAWCHQFDSSLPIDFSKPSSGVISYWECSSDSPPIKEGFMVGHLPQRMSIKRIHFKLSSLLSRGSLWFPSAESEMLVSSFKISYSSSYLFIFRLLLLYKYLYSWVFPVHMNLIKLPISVSCG